jgi:type VI secretion system protein ImpA
LAPLPGENPSGIGLRNEPLFHEVERLTQPQVEVVRDDRNVPVAEQTKPVDWPAVLAKAADLRSVGRDLRLLVIVTRALAGEKGLAGLAEGVDLVTQTCATYWDTLHPEMRPGAPPRDAAMRRLSALSQLESTTDGVLGDLRRTTFFTVRIGGGVTGEDLEYAMLDSRTLVENVVGLSVSEKAEAAARHDQRIDKVRNGCADLARDQPAEMERLLAGARAAVAAVDGLEAVLAEKLGPEGDRLPALRRFVRQVLASLEKPRPAAEPVGSAPAAGAAPEPSRNGAYEVKSEYVRFPERLGSRDDVVKCLDLVIDFYDRTEPSSPIPHLARRVRKMVPMNFLELMEDLAPSGLKEFRILAGVPENKKSSS